MPLWGVLVLHNPSTNGTADDFGASLKPVTKAGLPDRSHWAYTTTLMTKPQPLTRHISSINDLTNKEIETIFEVAQGFLKELADDTISYRIARSTDLASKFILASLFY
jgi:hypothetical protein